MPIAVRYVDFTVTAETISPAVPQWAGVQGEHQATAVRFSVPSSWLEADYLFRVEWIDGMQSFFTSDWIVPVQGKICCLLPQGWTAAGGTGEIRLVVYQEGDEVSQRQTVYSAAGRLTFSPRDEHQPATAVLENGLSELLCAWQQRLQCDTTAQGGCVCFDNAVILQYGKVTATEDTPETVYFDHALANGAFIQARSDAADIPITARTADGFTFTPEESGNVYWLAIGTLQNS